MADTGESTAPAAPAPAAPPAATAESDCDVLQLPTESSTASLMYTIAKKVCVVGAVYLAGYMNWSVAWFIGPLVLSVLRDQWRKESDLRRNVAKASAMASDKDIVLARLDELPAWVFFPDMERAEWLNRILVQVWPNVNHFARDIIKESIEPNVKKSLTAYKLNGFKFERMILGSIPPRVGGVKVYDKNLSRNEIIMDIDLFYAGDCDISFTLAGIKGGIKDFQIHGLLRVVMKPLIKSMPLVGGLQVFFLNNPTIDFNLVGVADILDMPGFSDVLRRCIVEQVATMMVLPNKLPIKLSDDIPSYDLKMPEPEGVLRIHVVEAKNLMKMDYGMLGKGKSDPYTLITVGAQEFRTQTINNNVNPKWDYWCEATTLYASGQVVEFRICDQDDMSKTDENLGRCSIEISSVSKKGHIDTWLTLEQAKHGMIHLRLSWYKLSNNLSDLRAAIHETQLLCVNGMSTAVLTIFIDSCKNLPNARPQSKPDPYLVINVGKKTENTSVLMRTSDPVYEIGYSFLVGNPENDTVHFKIMDQKTGNQLGMLDYNITGLLIKQNLSFDNEPFSLQRAGPDSKIYMSMCLRILKETVSDAADSNSDNVSLSTNAEVESITNGSPVKKSPVGSSTSSTENIADKLLQRSVSGDDDGKLLPEEELLIESSTDKLPQKRNVSGDDDGKLLHEEELLIDSPNYQPSQNSPMLIRRTASATSTAGAAGLGRIQITLRYNVHRQRLLVIVHKIVNIPLKDPANIPDPYVKLYLLPGRSKISKRKTAVMKDNCNPVFDEQFEYIMSQGECNSQSVEVTVASQKGFFAGSSPIIGEVTLNLNEFNLIEGQTLWLDLAHPTNVN